MIAKGLKLDVEQQAEVRRALQAQNEEIRRVMRGPSDPEVPRVAAIDAITHRTSERIRAVLSDEQRKLYGQRLPEEHGSGGKRSVQEWLNALHAHPD